ncbi:hypothetical protein CKA32_006227 [Geitlerinema sp. FC II]|nr:hypothetical protein CKA32_006227 [Geitlerinema sp. FC II]
MKRQFRLSLGASRLAIARAIEASCFNRGRNAGKRMEGG